MSNRVEAVATAIREIIRAPGGRAELALLLSQLDYWRSKTHDRLKEQRPASPLVLPPGVVPVTLELPDRMLTVAEACEVCGRSRSFLYERAVALGFGHRVIGVRGLRISECELRRWMLGK